MKRKEKKKTQRLKIRVVFTAAAGLLGAACSSSPTNSVAPSVVNSPCQDCGVTNPDGGHDGGVDGGVDAGTDGGVDGGDAG